MNLETKLNNSLNDILKSCGYIFEIINNNKKQSNIITGSNNQLITPGIIAQLSGNINKFDDILDDTVSKFNDARWCIEQILENKQKQEELKLKEEEARKRKANEEAKAKAEEEARLKKEQEVREAKEREERETKEREAREREQKAKEEELKKQEESQSQSNFGTFMSPGFDFNELPTNADKNTNNIPNPSDILSSINYKESGANNNNNANTDLDLDMNNILGNDESILDGLNMGLLDSGTYENSNNNSGNAEEFDVDSFLNQFGGGD